MSTVCTVCGETLVAATDWRSIISTLSIVSFQVYSHRDRKAYSNRGKLALHTVG